MYDLVIIGSGPAGLAAAIYAQRARLSFVVLEREYVSGGQVVNTYEVDNYPGLPGIGGLELGMKFREHADKLGTEFINTEVTELIDEGSYKKIVTEDGVYEAKAVIIATGAAHRNLNVPGEEELAGMGVSYCATCDGAFFKDRVVAVAGGGDVAVEDALFLARTCRKVYLIHRRDQLRAARILQEKLFACDNVEFIWNSNIKEICGEDHVECIKIEDTRSGEGQIIHVDGVFIAIGTVPNSELFSSMVQTNESGYVISDENCGTNVPGIFVAGDVRTKKLRQIITAAADGANAVTAVLDYLLQTM